VLADAPCAQATLRTTRDPPQASEHINDIIINTYIIVNHHHHSSSSSILSPVEIIITIDTIIIKNTSIIIINDTDTTIISVAILAQHSQVICFCMRLSRATAWMI
jgi:hypothetical protein